MSHAKERKMAGATGAAMAPLGSWGAVLEIDASRAGTQTQPARMVTLGEREWLKSEEAAGEFARLWTQPDKAWGEGPFCPLGGVLWMGPRERMREVWLEAIEAFGKEAVDADKKAREERERSYIGSGTMSERSSWRALSVFELDRGWAAVVIHQSAACERRLAMPKADELWRSNRAAAVAFGRTHYSMVKRGRAELELAGRAAAEIRRARAAGGMGKGSEVWAQALAAHQRGFGFNARVFDEEVAAGKIDALSKKEAALACWALAQKQQLEDELGVGASEPAAPAPTRKGARL